MERPRSLTQAAVILSSLPKRQAAMILSRLSSADAKTLLAAVTQLDRHSGRGVRSAFERFQKDSIRWSVENTSLDAIEDELAQLEAVISNDHNLVPFTPNEKPFDFLLETDRAIRAHLLSEEHPKNIAIVLSMFPPESASQTLNELESVLRISVLRRLCEIEEIHDEEVAELSYALKLRLKKLLSSWYSKSVGINLAAELLSCSDESTQEMLLEIMNQSDPDLADRLKKSVMSIDDLNKLSRDDIRILLKHVDTSSWAPALKNAPLMIQQLVLKSMGLRPREILQLEMAELGEVTPEAQNQARQSIIKEVLRLSREGQIQLRQRTTTQDVPDGFPTTVQWPSVGLPLSPTTS